MICDSVVSTLPINRFLQMMDPLPEDRILNLGASLRFRNVVLVALFLNRESVTRAATVYFPDHRFPFGRLYEARNRNPRMSPPGKTSVVVEIPSQEEEEYWRMEDGRLIEMVSNQLTATGLIQQQEIIGFEDKINQIFSYLDSIKNLRISGRNGKFLYTHVHDMMQFGREIIDVYPFV